MDATDIQNFRSGDDVDETFAEAVIHRPNHRVLGLTLRPFSFWHAANLDFIESPFAGHNKPIDFPALYVAARICQLRYPDPFRRRRFEFFIELWKARRYRLIKIENRKSRTVNRKTRISNDASRITQFPFLRELNRFSAYIRDYTSRPEYVANEESAPVKTPWYLYEVALYRRLNPETTWAQAWNMPIGEASWCNAAALEASGNKIDLVTPQMEKAFKKVEQQLRESKPENRESEDPNLESPISNLDSPK